MTVTYLPRPRAVPLYTTPYPGLGRRIAVLTNKGGVLKTATVVFLAAALGRRGRRVCVLDMEPQGDASRRLGVLPDDHTLHGSIGDALEANARGGAAQIIVPCGWSTPEADLIDVMPADTALADRDLEAHLPGADTRLRRILSGPDLATAYDYILIDCRPNLGHLERMITAALNGPDDGYLLPVGPDADAIAGATRAIDTVTGWADLADTTVIPLGVIVTLYDGRTIQHRQRAGSPLLGNSGALTATLAMCAADNPTLPGPPPVLRPYVPHNQHMAEVCDQGAPPSPYRDKRLVTEGVIGVFDQLAAQIDR